MQKILILTVIMIFASGVITAQSTAFNYQGNLKSGGVDANGSYDFEFALFDASSGGVQVGVTIPQNSVTVANGVFSVSLDFGSQFPGAGRFLEIRVRQAGIGSFTPLAPRQTIASTPYAVRSLAAATADNATQLGGLASTRYVQQDMDGNVSIAGNLALTGTATAVVVNAATQFNLGGQRLLSTPGGNNLFAGLTAGQANTSGYDNTFIGNGAGAANGMGIENTFLGASAGLRNTNGYDNVFVGINAGINNTTGFGNVAIGAAAGTANQNGAANTFVGTYAGLQATVGNNSFFGFFSGKNDTTGTENSFFGNWAGENNTTGNGNTFFGMYAGNLNQTGSLNTMFGRYAGALNTASNNAFFGANAGGQNSTGTDNTFVGTSSGAANTTGVENSFFGRNSGATNTTGGGNTLFGFSAGYTNQTGSFNTVMGRYAGALNTASYSAFFGAGAGEQNSTGIGNTFIGTSAGAVNTTGGGNTVLGWQATLGSTGLTNAIAIGANARADQSNSLILGSVAGVNGAASSVDVGIGTVTPLSKLDIAATGDGVSLLRFSTERPWEFRQVSTGATTGLRLISTSGIKKFEITASDGNNVATFLADSTTSRVGIGTTVPDQTLSVNGNASKIGGGSWLAFSDERLKNIKGKFSPGLKAVMSLQPLIYKYKADNTLGLKSDDEYVGFSAQAVEKVIPEAVTKNEQGFRLVNNDPIMWAMLNAIKEQETQIESQQKLISQQNAINKSQQADMAALKALVCVRNRRAAVCKRK